MKYRLLFMVFLVFESVYSQDCHLSLRGKVIDQHDKKPLEGAIISIFGTKKQVLSNSEGVFVLQGLCEGFYELEVSHLNCGTQFITLQMDNNLEKTFYLEHHVEELNEVALVKKRESTPSEQSLNAAVLDNSAAQNFAEALSQIQGVSTLKTGNGIAKPLIQGMLGSRVITHNQGVRMQDMEWGEEHAPNIATSSIEGVSLAVGAKALKYGSDAVGGVIVLDPRKPVFANKQRHEFIWAGQTNGKGVLGSYKLDKDFENGAFYGLQFAFKKSGNNLNSQGYLMNTGLEQTNLSIPLGWHKANKGIDVYFSFFKANNGILRNAHIGNIQDLINQINGNVTSDYGSFDYEIENPRQDVSHFLAKISTYYHIPSFGKWTFQYDYQRNRRKEFDIRLGDRNKLPGVDLQLTTHGFQSLLKLDTTNDKLVEFGWSTDYQLHYPNPATGVKRLIPDYNSLNMGAFVYGSKTLSNALSLEATIRTHNIRINADKYYKSSRWEALDYTEDFSSFVVEEFDFQILTAPKLNFQTISAALSLHYNKKEHKFHTNVQYIERAPNPAELFSEGLHHSAARIELGSLRMQKEKATKLGFQYQYLTDKRSVWLAPYLNLISDYMALIPTGVEYTIRGAFPVWEYQQTNARFTGVDFKWTEYFSKGIQMTNGWSVVKALDLKRNTAFPNIPPVNTHHELEKSFDKLPGLSFQVTGQYHFKQNEVPDNLTIYNPSTQSNQTLEINRAPNGFFLLSSVVEYQFPKSGNSQYKLRLSADNLTNLAYQNYLNRLRYFSNELGRNIQLQLQINF